MKKLASNLGTIRPQPIHWWVVIVAVLFGIVLFC
jgi:hypothetical protein